MVNDGIKAAQIQAKYSPLIGSTWTASSSQTANVLAAIKHALARLNPRWPGHRPAGRHVAPGRSFPRRHAPRLLTSLISANSAAYSLWPCCKLDDGQFSRSPIRSMKQSRKVRNRADRGRPGRA